jgi:hypothetical protein
MRGFNRPQDASGNELETSVKPSKSQGYSQAKRDAKVHSQLMLSWIKHEKAWPLTKWDQSSLCVHMMDNDENQESQASPPHVGKVAIPLDKIYA